MKWLAFTIAVVVALVALGVMAVVPSTVIWEARQPHCPSCRAEINLYAELCAACDRSLSWDSKEEECRWCLSKDDVQYLRDAYGDLELNGKKHSGLLAQFPVAYFRVMEPGACTYCAGLGKLNEGEAEVTCPVCRGLNKNKCIGCEGDRELVVGDEDAHRTAGERRVAWARARYRSGMTRRTMRKSALVDQDVEALSGYVEAEEIVDERGSPLLKRAQTRAALAYEALEEAQRSNVTVEPGNSD